MKINKQKFSFYYRGSILIIIAMFLGVIVAKKYLSYTTPMYECTSKIRLADLEEGSTGNNLFKDLDVFATKNELAAEIEVVKSQVLIQKVMSKLNFDTELSRVGEFRKQELYSNRPFNLAYTISNTELLDKELTILVKNRQSYSIRLNFLNKTYTGKFGKVLTIPNYGKIELQLHKELVNQKSEAFLVDEFLLVFKSQNALYEEISKDLDVVLVDKEVPVMKIIYKNKTPQKASEFVNALAQTYIEDFIDSKFKTAETTSEFLDNQIDDVHNKLKATETDIQNYRDEHNIINVVQETETDLRKISQLKIQKTNVKMTLDAINELNDYVKKGESNFLSLAPNFESYTDLLSTELVKKIKAHQEEKTDLLMTYSPSHPKVLAIDEKIDQKKQYIIEAIQNTKNNLESKYKNLSSDISEAESVFIGLPEKERILHTLDRNFNLQEQSYVFLNQKRIEAEIAKSANISFHRIITIAAVPKKPVSPNRSIITIVFSILGGGGTMLLIYIIHLLKGKVNDLETIEKKSNISILSSAPHLKPEEVNTHFSRETLQLQLKQFIHKNMAIAFTASKNGQGDLFQALNFGLALERQGVSVRFLQIGERKETTHSNFTIIPFSQLENSTPDALKLLTKPTSKDEVVIILNENLSDNRISSIIMGMVNLNLFVVDSRKTMASEIEKVTLSVQNNGLENTYFILNNEGYVPTIFHESKNIFRKLIKRLKSSK
jgi:uncharacterized protein involved in exopolysaccharide biosynthesis